MCRLGALGFLSLDIDEASGNAAIKDILLALKWVKENIERFGGDPNKITLGGHSSGAAIIHCLAVSKHSINLFNQVILISGNADNPRSLSRHAKENALTLAKELGLPINDVNILLNKLREINVFDIIDAETNLTKYDEVILRPFSMFTPTVEIESSHAIITSEPRELELLQNIKILTGFNYREGIFLIPKINNTAKLKKLNKEMELAIPSNIEYPLKSKISLDLAKSIGEKYFNTNLSNFTLNNIIDLASDSQYIYGIDSWVKKLKQMNNSNDLYYYIFDFDGGLNWAKLYYKIDFPGTAHADELGYVFVTRNTAPLLNHVDHKSNLVMNMLLTLFSNFIKYGNPTPAGFTSDFKWEKYNKDGTLLYIREKPVKGTLSNQLVDRLKFWDDVYEKYYNYIKSGGKLEKKCIP
ncbi:juvenile hormone esterase-like isoform X2 [Battus philenor]|uniref:juvenile hormone esterase-like isoform X2 n=1 Tax=Battus philenor TaxID=42288 RepID=UPI0035CEE420